MRCVQEADVRGEMKGWVGVGGGVRGVTELGSFGLHGTGPL